MFRSARRTFWGKATILYADLSKVYAIIQRFPGDIDLSLSQSALGDGLVVPNHGS